MECLIVVTVVVIGILVLIDMVSGSSQDIEKEMIKIHKTLDDDKNETK